jgi:PIN domain nuclease of toxin-antitoxin system
VIRFLLDTHALIWVLKDDRRLGRRANRIVERAWTSGTLGVSAISYWEIALLVDRKRARLDLPISTWRREVIDAGIEEVALTGDLAIDAVSLTWRNADPADRFIVATALRDGATLLTADAAILEWVGPLKCHDAST